MRRGRATSTVSISRVRSEMTYTSEEDEFRAVLLGLQLRDEGVGVRVRKVQAGAGPLSDQCPAPLMRHRTSTHPVSEEPLLDVLLLELASEQPIAPQEDLCR